MSRRGACWSRGLDPSPRHAAHGCVGRCSHCGGLLSRSYSERAGEDGAVLRLGLKRAAVAVFASFGAHGVSRSHVDRPRHSRGNRLDPASTGGNSPVPRAARPAENVRSSPSNIMGSSIDGSRCRAVSRSLRPHPVRTAPEDNIDRRCFWCRILSLSGWETARGSRTRRFRESNSPHPARKTSRGDHEGSRRISLFGASRAARRLVEDHRLEYPLPLPGISVRQALFSSGTVHRAWLREQHRGTPWRY